MSRRSFTDIRSAFFREHCFRIAHEQREYGGRSLDDYDLSDFRVIHAAATSQAIDYVQRALRVYNHASKQWEQRT